MRLIATALLGCLLTSAAALDVAEPAPSLAGVEWVKGEAPDFSQQVTVVEFWATWCGPCLQSIPHLTKLQEEYGDQVAIVGLSDEERSTIEPFVEQQGAGMAYNVGRLTGAEREAYMADVSGIPHAFIVSKEGKVLWKGHPMTMDRPLEMIINGTFDPELAKQVSAKEQALQQSFQTRDMAKIKQAALDVLALDPSHMQGLYVFAGVSQQEGEIEDYREYFSGLDPAELGSSSAATIADLLLSAEQPSFRLLDVAVSLAKHAVEAAPEDSESLAVWAKARYMVGDLEGAVKHAKRAAELAGDDQELTELVDYYQQAKALGSKDMAASK